jgi:hypothetical protein
VHPLCSRGFPEEMALNICPLLSGFSSQGVEVPFMGCGSPFLGTKRKPTSPEKVSLSPLSCRVELLLLGVQREEAEEFCLCNSKFN